MSWHILKIVFIRGLRNIILEMVIYLSLPKKKNEMFLNLSQNNKETFL